MPLNMISIPHNMIFRKSIPVASFGFLLFLVPLILPSCTHDPTGIELLDTVCFSPTIMGILQSSCAECHDGSTEGFSVSDTASIMAMVVPGDPRGSQLYKVLTEINGENFMPPDHPISKEYRTLIEVWIAQGAPKNYCGGSTGGNGGGGGGGGTLKDCTDSIYFEQKILPLFTTKCVSCHDGLSHGDEDNLLKLDSYQAIRSNVNLTSPESSRVYRVLSQSGEDRMPPSPDAPLTASEKSMMLNWIKEGARDNSCLSGVCDTAGTITYAANIAPIIEQYCLNCHRVATTLNTGVALSSFDQVKAMAQTLRPNAQGGTPVLIGAVKRMANFKAMPKTYSLDDCSVRTMELWVAQGLN